MSIIIKSEEGVTLECLHNVNQKLAVCIEEEGTYPLVFEFDNEKDVDFFIEELRKSKKSVFNQEQIEDKINPVKIIRNGVIDPLLKTEISGRVYNHICKLYRFYNIPEELNTIKDAYDFIGCLTAINGISRKSVAELNHFFKTHGLCPDYPTTNHYIKHNKDVFVSKLEGLIK